MNTMRRSVWGFAPAMAMLSLGAWEPAWAATLAVNCNGNPVGTITVNASAGGAGGGGISGGFTSSVGGPPATLAAAAAACGETEFNWYQIVTSANNTYVDRQGNTLTPPFVDPPLNGLATDIDPTWADNMPWYYDMYSPPAGTPNFDSGYLLSNNTTSSTLNFSDYPNGPAGATVSFSTWLVSLNADGSFQAFDGGFSWTWTKGTGVTNITTFNTAPTNAQYANIIGGFAYAVPEPSSLWLVALGAGFVLARRRRRVG